MPSWAPRVRSTISVSRYRIPPEVRPQAVLVALRQDRLQVPEAHQTRAPSLVGPISRDAEHAPRCRILTLTNTSVLWRYRPYTWFKGKSGRPPLFWGLPYPLAYRVQLFDALGASASVLYEYCNCSSARYWARRTTACGTRSVPDPSPSPMMNPHLAYARRWPPWVECKFY